MREPTLGEAVRTFGAFLSRRPLAEALASLEANVEHATALEVRAAATAAGVDAGLLASATTVRRELGRVDDLIHAATILQLLPVLLGDDETLVSRPSLAAGGDPRRPFDVETNLRVASFRLATWTGHDTTRKRELVKDFVHLAADASGRRPELLVVGPEPARFLQTSRSKVAWALERSPGTLRLFTERFGDVSASLASFAAGAGARVQIIDVVPLLPPGVLEPAASEDN